MFPAMEPRALAHTEWQQELPPCSCKDCREPRGWLENRPTACSACEGLCLPWRANAPQPSNQALMRHVESLNWLPRVEGSRGQSPRQWQAISSYQGVVWCGKFLIQNVAGVTRLRRLKGQNLGFGVCHRTVFNTTRHDAKLARLQSHATVTELNRHLDLAKPGTSRPRARDDATEKHRRTSQAS